MPQAVATGKKKERGSGERAGEGPGQRRSKRINSTTLEKRELETTSGGRGKRKCGFRTKGEEGDGNKSRSVQTDKKKRAGRTTQPDA